MHVAPQRLQYVNLNYFNPEATTPDARTSNYTATFADKLTIGGGLLDNTLSVTRFGARVWGQGTEELDITPSGNSGNYFLHSTQAASRDQGLVQGFLPKFQWAGAHQIQVGADASWLRYTADNSRTGYQVLSLSGQIISQTLFPNPAPISAEVGFNISGMPGPPFGPM